MSVVAIIPARYASTRLPGKPLVKIAGFSLIERVYRQVEKAKGIDRIIIATDDDRIAEHVLSFGGDVRMTGVHSSGTDRVGAVAEGLNAEYIINVQGDEPLLPPDHVSRIVDALQNGNDIATLITRIKDASLLFDYNCVKVVKDIKNRALYFSRQVIPAIRDRPFTNWIDEHPYYQHIGIYGFRKDVLSQIIQLSASTLEQVEKLEQLRWLYNGYQINCQEVSCSVKGVDTPEDRSYVEKLILASGS
jgi:3-deoxy-manno-octulosonate cytidylyltransferase (CMP-KDO synthetase)